MEEKKTIYHYLGQLFFMYGIIVLIFVFLSCTVNEQAVQSSPLFALGKEGLTMDTLVQLFGFCVCLLLLRILFLTDVVIKNLQIAIRSLCFVVATVLIIILFVYSFSWFSMNDTNAWIGFFVSYTVCTSVGILISLLKEKAENKKMEQGLKRIRES